MSPAGHSIPVTLPTRLVSRAFLAFAVPLFAFPVPVRAQASGSPALILDAGIAHSLPPGEAILDESVSYGLLGVRVDVPVSRALLLFGSAYGGLTTEAHEGNWASGTVGMGLVHPVGTTVDLGLAGWGSGFTVGGQFPYRGVTARLSPELRLFSGSWSAAARLTGAIGRTHTTFRRLDRALTFANDVWSWGASVEVGRTAGAAGASMAFDAFDSSSGAYYAGSARARLATGPVTTRLELDVWQTPTGFEPAGRVALSVALGRTVETELYGGRSPPDPLLATRPAADFGAILSWQLLGFPSVAPEAPPRPDSVMVAVQLRYEGAEKVYVVGDFTLWIPEPMQLHAGEWEVQLSVEPGVYEYGFIVDGDWYVPLDAGGLSTDDWGQLTATLVVPPP